MALTKVTSHVLADNAVTSVKIAENAITSRELATNAIVTLYIADNGVTSVKIAENNVTAREIATNSLTAAHIPNATDLTLGTVTAALTGNASGTAATVTGAAQTNITSLGTLTALTVDDVAIDGKVVTMTGSSGDTAVLTVATNGALSLVTTDAAAAAANIQITADGTVDIDSAGVLTLDSGAAINIEPASGSAILLDGTISVDAGVVTGATSITSTAFVGDITGDVTGNTSGTAATVTTAAQPNITSLGTLTTLTVDNVIINGTTIGHTGDTDLITVASGIATVAGEVSMTTLDIGGTNVTSTAAEINLLDALDRGSILYGNASGATTVLGQGSADQVLTSDGTDIAWADASSFDADAAQVFNESGADVDFRIEGDTNTHMFFLDASGDFVGIGTSSPAKTLHVYKSGDGQTPFRLQTGNATGLLDFYNDSSSWYLRSDATLRFHAKGSGFHTFHCTDAETEMLKIFNNGLVKAAKSAMITQAAITSSSNAIAWNAATQANAYHVTTENTTFSAPSNAVEGQIISVEIAQGGTARTIAWNTIFEFAASTAPTITATANKTDILSFRYNGSVWQEIGRVQNMAQT